MLSEVMNVPGVINNDPDVIGKIEIAKKYRLKIDGHAPELVGDPLSLYIAHGIETDHESSTIEEAEEKISKGMHIMIREGSAAKNYNELKSLIATRTDSVMFCTDDSHADDLLNEGHINKIVKKALADGFGIFDILQIACLNPVRFYNLNIGTLHIGDNADFIILDDIESLNIRSTYIRGEVVYGENSSKNNSVCDVPLLNKFHHDEISLSDLHTNVFGDVTCIQVKSDSLLTDRKILHFDEKIENFQSDLDKDVLKIVYLNRYFNSKPQVGFISGIGLKRGAFASSISHDSHNIIAVGCTDQDLMLAINELIKEKGGLVVNEEGKLHSLPLPIGGIISDRSGEEVADRYMKLNEILSKMGTPLKSPFMTLSFMALIVIPTLKIGEKGIFDFEKFDFVK